MSERELHICFYTGSLNHKATSNLPGQLESGFHYIQKFYTHQDYTFEQQNSQDFLLTQKYRHTPCKNQTYRPEITSGKLTRGTRTSKPDGGSP